MTQSQKQQTNKGRKCIGKKENKRGTKKVGHSHFHSSVHIIFSNLYIYIKKKEIK